MGGGGETRRTRKDYSTSSCAPADRTVNPINSASMFGRLPKHFGCFFAVRNFSAARFVSNVTVAVSTESFSESVGVKETQSLRTPQVLARSFLVVDFGIPLIRREDMVHEGYDPKNKKVVTKWRDGVL
jgi:hypothetical protein